MQIWSQMTSVHDDHDIAEKRRRDAPETPTMLVGSVDDPQEAAADRIADAVMRVVGAPGPGAPAPGTRVGRSALPGRRESVPQAPSRISRSAARTTPPDGRPIGPDGGAVDAETSSRIRRKAGRGARLDDRVAPQMEQALGRSLSDVRVHDDAESAQLSRSLGARAFTVGNDIFFGAGEHRPDTASGQHMLAHEVGHVVTETGGGAHRTPVVRRLFGIGKKGKKSDKKPAAPKNPSLSGAAANSGADAKSDAAPKPDLSLADSIAYEDSLGRFLFNHPVSRFAATAMVDRLITALMKDFDISQKKTQDDIAKMFGRDKVASAGQVGTNFDDVWAAMSTGNLRERMTAIYNVMFTGVKEEIQSIMDRNAWAEAEKRGFDSKKLKRRKKQMKRNPGAKDLYRDPGNPLDRKKFGSFSLRGHTRDAAEETSKRTVGDLEKGQGKFGIGLSDREKKLHKKGTGAVQFDDQTLANADISDEKLKWQEGGTYWKVNNDNKWVKKVTNKMHMPVIAGPSGTSLRLWQLWEFLGKPVPASHWRSAILGWMLSSNDHSFHEMMMIARDYGLPYIADMKSYRRIEPFSEEELRVGAAIDQMFPDELAFVRSAEAGEINLVSVDDELDSSGDVEKTGSVALANELAKDNDLQEYERAAVIALLAYTDESPAGYKFMNNAATKGWLGPKFYKFIREDKTLKAAYKSNKFKIKDLANESKQLSDFASDAMSGGYIDTYKGKVYRGFKTMSRGGWKKGQVITTKKFMSFSDDREVAESFTGKGVGLYRMLIELDSKTGVELKEYSHFDEGEVLFKPGSKFQVDDVPQQATFTETVEKTRKVKGTDGKKTKQKVQEDVDRTVYVVKWSDVSPVKADPELARDASADVTLDHLQWNSDAEQKAYEDALFDDGSDTSSVASDTDSSGPPAYDPRYAYDSTLETLTLPKGTVLDTFTLMQMDGDEDNWQYDVPAHELTAIFLMSRSEQYALFDAMNEYFKIGEEEVKRHLLMAAVKQQQKANPPAVVQDDPLAVSTDSVDTADTSPPAYDPDKAFDPATMTLTFPSGHTLGKQQLDAMMQDEDSWHQFITPEDLTSLAGLDNEGRRGFVASMGVFFADIDTILTGLTKAQEKHLA